MPRIKFFSINFKIIVKNGYQLVKPLIIYHITNSDIWSKNINLRLDFELGKDSSLRLIDLFNDTSEKNFLNIFYNFDLKENAVLKNYKVDKLENKNIKTMGDSVDLISKIGNYNDFIAFSRNSNEENIKQYFTAITKSGVIFSSSDLLNWEKTFNVNFTK